jgi:hypothetical protein
MESALFILGIVLFAYIVTTLLLAVLTRLLQFRNAGVPRAAFATLCSFVSAFLLSFPIAFLLEIEGNAFDTAFLVVALVASTIVIRGIYRTSWVRALVAAGLIAISWGIITYGLSLVEASMR